MTESIPTESVVLQYRSLQAEGQLTLPVNEAECRQCCEVISEEANVAACQDLGCSSDNANDNCFADGETSEFCLNGRDFLLSGASNVEGNDLRCNGGVTEAFEGFDNVPPNVDVEEADETNCQSCCSSINDELDEIDIFTNAQCFSACGGQRNCFNEGNFGGRFACFVGSDLISIGQSTFTLSDGTLQDIQCVDGVLELIEANGGGDDGNGDYGEDDGGGNDGNGDYDEDDGNDNGNEDNGNDDVIGVIVGVVAGVLALGLLAMFFSRRNKNKSSTPSREELQKSAFDSPPMAMAVPESYPASIPKAMAVNESRERERPSLNFLIRFMGFGRGSRGSVDITIPGLGGVIDQNPANRANRNGGEVSGERRLSGLAPPGRMLAKSRITTWFSRMSSKSSSTLEGEGSRFQSLRTTKRSTFFPVQRNKKANVRAMEMDIMESPATVPTSPRVKKRKKRGRNMIQSPKPAPRYGNLDLDLPSREF